MLQDTKLSRMQRAAGPLAPVLEFLRDHREPNATSGGQQWVADRKRELMYSQVGWGGWGWPAELPCSGSARGRPRGVHARSTLGACRG